MTSLASSAALKAQIVPSAPAAPMPALGGHTFRQRYLLAFASQGELLNYGRTQILDGESALPGLFEKWQKLRPRVQGVLKDEAGLCDTISIEALPKELAEVAAKTESDVLFQRTFQQFPTKFAMVEVDKLVAPQRTVNLDYAARQADRFAANLSPSGLWDACGSLKREMDPIQHLEVAPNTHVFSSPNSDVRFLGAFMKNLDDEDLNYAKTGGIPVAAVIAFVGYGGSPVNGLKVGNRVVLNNGFHRVFSLRSLGVKKVPMAIQHVQNPDLEINGAIAGLPKEYLLGAPRPVLMKDFFEPDFVADLDAKERIRTVGISIGLNQHDIPA